VLGSFLGSTDWAGESSFFSAAQELGGDDLNDWWQDQAEPAPPASDYLADINDFGFGLPLAAPSQALAGFAPEPVPAVQDGRKRGLLGRFF
jgi:hypothetical protein